MPKVSWSDGDQTIDIDSAVDLPLYAWQLVRFADTLTKLGATIGLDKLDVVKVRNGRWENGDDRQDIWDYSWKAVDGRTWTQGMRWVDGERQDGYFTVDTPGDGPNDAWLTMPELAANREARSCLARLIQEYGVTRVKARW